jgi:hypothetical protein
MSHFTVGIIQDHAGTDRQDNVRPRGETGTPGGRQRAQIICLKELF